jgi:hypothetical protein
MAKRSVVEYVRHRVREDQKKSGRSDQDVANEIGTSAAFVNQLRHGKRGIGDSEDGFAKMYAGGSIDKLRREAEKWWSTQPQREEVSYDKPGGGTELGDLPGWRKAMESAREKYGVRRGIPAWAFERALEICAGRPAQPDELTILEYAQIVVRTEKAPAAETTRPKVAKKTR